MLIRVDIYLLIIPLLDRIVTFCLPIFLAIILIPFAKGCSPITTFYPCNGHFALRNSDFIFLVITTLRSLHQYIFFGCFHFIRYWISKRERYVVLASKYGYIYIYSKYFIVSRYFSSQGR